MKSLRNRTFHLGFSALIFLGLPSCANAPKSQVENRIAVSQSPEERAISEATGRSWIVSTQGRAATKAVDEIYRRGGNIIDAAIAASFAISVERPQSTGLGGGGFLLYRSAKTGKVQAIDFRERAPSRATEKMYLDGKGEVIPDKSVYGIQSAGVPGLVKGLAEIHAKWGKLPFSETIGPAVRLAEEGVEVYPYLANALSEEKENLAKYPATAQIFLKAGNEPYVLGEKIVQKDLAASLREIARTGGKAFYEGKIARAIESVTDGWISRKDLKAYRVRWLAPVEGSFRGYRVYSMPAPSSGGTHVIEILNILENFPLASWGFFTPQSIHATASAMQMSFVDRARYLGDPDFVPVPAKTLTSKEYAKGLAAKIRLDHAFRADELATAMPVLPEHSETTHFSIMDAEGNVVVSTQTINGWFGSGVVVPGTGILLNDEMDDFSAKPGAANIFGAIGSRANSVQPGKTPLSSMSPTIVLKDGKPVLAVGAPGGTRIINCVAQTILNYLEYRMPLYDSVASLRVHHQWKPDELLIEGDRPLAAESVLRTIGYDVKRGTVGCAVMAVAREGDVLRGVSEPRDHGMALGDTSSIAAVGTAVPAAAAPTRK